MLHASLRLAAAHLLPTTPAVFYIFTVADQLPLLAAGLRDIVQQQQVRECVCACVRACVCVWGVNFEPIP